MKICGMEKAWHSGDNNFKRKRQAAWHGVYMSFWLFTLPPWDLGTAHALRWWRTCITRGTSLLFSLLPLSPPPFRACLCPRHYPTLLSCWVPSAALIGLVETSSMPCPLHNYPTPMARQFFPPLVLVVCLALLILDSSSHCIQTSAIIGLPLTSAFCLSIVPCPLTCMYLACFLHLPPPLNSFCACLPPLFCGTCGF